MKTNARRWWTLLLTGCVGLAGCARSSVAVNPGLTEAPANPAAVNALGVAQAEKPVPGDRFAFPADKGGKALDELLRPPQKLSVDLKIAPGPKPLVAPPSVERPEPALPANQATLPQAKLTPKAPPLRPHMLAEAAPLTGYRNDPPPVVRQEFTPGALVRLPSRDVNQPLPLPILAHPGIDRAPLDDPSAEESLKAVLAATMPVRMNPAPFARRNLPDPFENSQTVRLRALPPEEPNPASGPLRPPKP